MNNHQADHCVAGGSDPVPLAQKRIAEFLCGDVKRGKQCPHHERKAKELLFVILHAQQEERERNTVAALDRIAGFIEDLNLNPPDTTPPKFSEGDGRALAEAFSEGERS